MKQEISMLKGPSSGKVWKKKFLREKVTTEKLISIFLPMKSLGNKQYQYLEGSSLIKHFSRRAEDHLRLAKIKLGPKIMLNWFFPPQPSIEMNKT